MPSRRLRGRQVKAVTAGARRLRKRRPGEGLRQLAQGPRAQERARAADHTAVALSTLAEPKSRFQL